MLTIVVGSVLFTHAVKTPLEYFIQLLRTNRLRVFLKAIFVTLVLKNPHPVNCDVLFRVFRFSAAPFNAVTSFIRNIFKPGRHLGNVAIAIL